MLNELEKKLSSHFSETRECVCVPCSATRKLATSDGHAKAKLSLLRRTFITYLVYTEPSYLNWSLQYRHCYIDNLGVQMCSVCGVAHSGKSFMCEVCSGFSEGTFHVSWALPNGPTVILSEISNYRGGQIRDFAVKHLMAVSYILARHICLPVTAIELILPLLFPDQEKFTMTYNGMPMLDAHLTNEIANMYC